MKKNIWISVFLCLFVVGAIIACAVGSKIFSDQQNTIWKYQCIDTMKISRDAARGLTGDKRHKKIDAIVSSISDMGANCIAIGTPYDEEFLPVLKDWVAAARAHHLHVWFRGNFSGWEGWFGYKADLTSDDLLKKTQQFISAHHDLFQDGDIFTPAPEAENGWRDGDVGENGYAKLKTFLVKENQVAKDAFGKIGKHVDVNWLSMSGGVAQGALDQQTIDSIDKTVTIDHYVKDLDDMDKFVNYFHDTFGATVVLGEFGAPIPDLNGDMTEDEQAAFVDKLLQRLYKLHDKVYGLNYWDIQYGSTALLDDTGKPKKVVSVIEKYFKPAIVSGRVIDTAGNPIKNIHVDANDGIAKTTTDSNGYYRLLIPADKVTIIFSGQNYKPVAQTYALEKGKVSSHEIVVDSLHKDMWDNIILFLKHLFGRE